MYSSRRALRILSFRLPTKVYWITLWGYFISQSCRVEEEDHEKDLDEEIQG